MFNIPGFNPGGAINRQTTMFQPPTGRELFPFIATGRPRTRMIDFPVEGAMQIRRPGLFPSAYDRMRAGYINDNNDPDYPGVWDNRLSRTPSQGAIDRYNRMYGVRGRMATAGRGVHRIGMGGGYMVAGSLAAEFAGQAVGGAGGEILSGLGQGAMMGGQIGMILGPKGALAGAAIGAVLGGIAPLMDKGVRDGVGTFISGMVNTMKALGAGIVTGVTELGSGLLSSLSSLPRMVSGVMQSIYNTLPAPVKATMGFLNTAWSGVTGLVQRLNIPNLFYAGKDYAGPAMALEARMSGHESMVVNGGEFVIPRDGIPTLAGIVGDNLRTTGAMNYGTSQPVQVNVTLAITTHSVVADPNELANALRDPVYKIIGEAWNEAYKSTRIHRPKVS